MNSKLVNIKYKKGDHIKLTREYLENINFDERMKQINSEVSQENKVEALELLEEIRVGLVIDYIKKHCELEVDAEEYNLLYNILKEQFQNNGVECPDDFLAKEVMSKLMEEVIYQTFAKENDVQVKESEIDKMLELASGYIHNFNSYSDLEKRALVVDNLRKSKVQKVFREFFNIDFDAINYSNKEKH